MKTWCIVMCEENCEQSRTCTACGKPGYHDGEKFVHTGDEAEDVSETSAAENSRCELCGQPAPNVDLRLDARGNGSALKALICSDCALDLELRMDEDTAGGSVQSDYTETGDSVQRENTELEPAAYLIGQPGYAGLFFNEEHFVREKMYESLDEAREAAAKHEDFDFEPLVRLSDVLNRLKQINSNVGEVARDFHRDEETAADISPADHVDRKIWSPLDRLIEELEEFTQNGDME